MIEQVCETGRPIVLTQQGHPSAVLVDLDTYQRLVDELEILRDIHGGLQDVAEGRITPHDEARAELLARYS